MELLSSQSNVIKRIFFAFLPVVSSFFVACVYIFWRNFVANVRPRCASDSSWTWLSGSAWCGSATVRTAGKTSHPPTPSRRCELESEINEGFFTTVLLRGDFFPFFITFERILSFGKTDESRDAVHRLTFHFRGRVLFALLAETHHR